MNERIIELADKAVEDISSGPWNISDEFCIKFAELIIRECVQACINEGETYEVKSAGFYSSNLYASAIRNHFGVELQQYKVICDRTNNP